MAKFQKGISGNVAGRRPGNITAQKLREAIAEQLPDIIDVLVKQSLTGCTASAKLLLERALPPLKAQSEAVTINTVPDDTTATIGRLILDETMRGQLTPDISSQLLTALAAQVRIEEYTLLESRISALEGGSK